MTEEELKDLENEVNELDDFVENESDKSDDTESVESVESNTSESSETVVTESSEQSESPTEVETEHTETIVESVNDSDATSEIPHKPEIEVEDDTVSTLRTQIDNLTSQLLALKSQPTVQTTKTSKASETNDKEQSSESSTTSQQAQSQESYEAIDFIGDLNMDDVTADKKIFNQVINNAVMKAIENAEKFIKPNVLNETLLSIPNVISSQIKEQAYINSAVDKFYEENSDLTNVKNTVGLVAQNIATEHPDYDITTLFNEAAKATRVMLKLPEASKIIENNEKVSEFQKPAFAANTSKRSTSVKVSDLQRELDEL
jgi:hypothetical protein